MTVTLQRPIIVDTREHPGHAWFRSEITDGSAKRATLSTADYTIEGLESLILVERKALGDLVGCVGYARQRFERELVRMSAETTVPVLVIEAVPSQVEAHDYRGRVTPAAVFGSLAAWSLDYRLRVHWGGAPASCEGWLRRLFAAVERRVDRGDWVPRSLLGGPLPHQLDNRPDTGTASGDERPGREAEYRSLPGGLIQRASVDVGTPHCEPDARAHHRPVPKRGLRAPVESAGRRQQHERGQAGEGIDPREGGRQARVVGADQGWHCKQATNSGLRISTQQSSPPHRVLGGNGHREGFGAPKNSTRNELRRRCSRCRPPVAGGRAR